MPTLLCITLRFIGSEPAFHGQRDGDEPEWPPSPLRVFQALLAAAADRWRGEQFRGYVVPALSWLERLPPPDVVAPQHHVGTAVRLAVPNNDLDLVAAAWSKGHEPKKQPSELKTLKTVRPTHLRGGEAVHYLYPVADGDPAFAAHRDTLRAAARGVTHVGWGVDMVAADADLISEEDADTLPGERWRLAEGAAGGLRVPVPGTLAGLTDKHAAFLGRLAGGGFKPVPPLSAYRVVGYRRPTDPRDRPFAAFTLMRPEDPSRARPYDTPRWAASVAGMVRHATAVAALRAGWSPERINTFVHGHTPDGTGPARGDAADGRFAYLPLPSVERRGERGPHVGMIRRVLVVGPPGGRREVDWARQALAGAELFQTGKDGPDALLVPVPNPDADWNVQRYAGGSAAWSTVTPVVLPGYDDGDPAKAEGLLKKAFRQAGWAGELVDRAELAWRAVGFRPGVELAGRYMVPEPLGRRPRFHVRVRWPAGVRGPVAVGAGRYRGLGVFAVEAAGGGLVKRPGARRHRGRGGGPAGFGRRWSAGRIRGMLPRGHWPGRTASVSRGEGGGSDPGGACVLGHKSFDNLGPRPVPGGVPSRGPEPVGGSGDTRRVDGRGGRPRQGLWGPLAGPAETCGFGTL